MVPGWAGGLLVVPGCPKLVVKSAAKPGWVGMVPSGWVGSALACGSNVPAGWADTHSPHPGMAEPPGAAGAAVGLARGVHN